MRSGNPGGQTGRGGPHCGRARPHGLREADYRCGLSLDAEDVEKLRDAGWNENQISEAVYITAMFAFFNRVADAFGIPPQNYLTREN